MDEVEVPIEAERLLPRVAQMVAEWFPDLEGRALAVSDATIDAENVPTLPLVIVALAKGVSNQTPNAPKSPMTLTDTFIVEFWMKPERYKRADCTETPFWSYYDYEAVRNRLLGGMRRVQGPNNERIVYAGLTQEASPFAVVLTFTFTATFQPCIGYGDEPTCSDAATLDSEDGRPVTVLMNICQPKVQYCPRAVAEDKDPCAFASE